MFYIVTNRGIYTNYGESYTNLAIFREYIYIYTKDIIGNIATYTKEANIS
jgi:hypothetical protein